MEAIFRSRQISKWEEKQQPPRYTLVVAALFANT
jgi:hypothetical protein